MKKIAIFTFCIFLIAANSFARVLEGIPDGVDTPEKFVQWLSGEFQYRFEFPDKWQTPEETLSEKGGDCEDFAILTSVFLRDIGYADNDVIIVSFRGLSVAHALCIWKNADGTYNYISNKKMFNTRETSIKAAVNKYYPDWEKITFLSPEKKEVKVVRR